MQACCDNRTILPDAYGSAGFRAMLDELGLLGDVTAARQATASSHICACPSLLTPLAHPSQDSGKLERFAEMFGPLSAGGGKGCATMASEIENFGDIRKGISLGYTLRASPAEHPARTTRRLSLLLPVHTVCAQLRSHRLLTPPFTPAVHRYGAGGFFGEKRLTMTELCDRHTPTPP